MCRVMVIYLLIGIEIKLNLAAKQSKPLIIDRCRDMVSQQFARIRIRPSKLMSAIRPAGGIGPNPNRQ